MQHDVFVYISQCRFRTLNYISLPVLFTCIFMSLRHNTQEDEMYFYKQIYYAVFIYRSVKPDHLWRRKHCCYTYNCLVRNGTVFTLALFVRHNVFVYISQCGHCTLTLTYISLPVLFTRDSTSTHNTYNDKLYFKVIYNSHIE